MRSAVSLLYRWGFCKVAQMLSGMAALNGGLGATGLTNGTAGTMDALTQAYSGIQQYAAAALPTLYSQSLLQQQGAAGSQKEGRCAPRPSRHLPGWREGLPPPPPRPRYLVLRAMHAEITKLEVPGAAAASASRIANATAIESLAWQLLPATPHPPSAKKERQTWPGNPCPPPAWTNSPSTCSWSEEGTYWSSVGLAQACPVHTPVMVELPLPRHWLPG